MPEELLTLGGQQRLLEVSTFNTWIEARSEGRSELAALHERRFSPEFKLAFDAWLAADPFSIQAPRRDRASCPSASMPGSTEARS